jgi:inorganic triphosphatase YgiF
MVRKPRRISISDDDDVDSEKAEESCDEEEKEAAPPPTKKAKTSAGGGNRVCPNGKKATPDKQRCADSACSLQHWCLTHKRYHPAKSFNRKIVSKQINKRCLKETKKKQEGQNSAMKELRKKKEDELDEDEAAKLERAKAFNDYHGPVSAAPMSRAFRVIVCNLLRIRRRLPQLRAAFMFVLRLCGFAGVCWDCCVAVLLGLLTLDIFHSLI